MARPAQRLRFSPASLVVTQKCSSTGLIAPTPIIYILSSTFSRPVAYSSVRVNKILNTFPESSLLKYAAAYYNEARLLDPVTFDTVKVLPNIPGSVGNPLAGRNYPFEGASVLLPQHAPYTDESTVMICGGSDSGGNALDNCVSIQPEAGNPTWVIERMVCTSVSLSDYLNNGLLSSLL